MRAAYVLPYERLIRYTRDPLADLESGRYDGLVAAALDDAGLAPARSASSVERKHGTAPGAKPD
jgi:hypothetical protein